MLEHVTSLDDPRLADYRNVRDADLRGRGGRFLAEGRQIVRVLFEVDRFAPCSVLVTEAALRSLDDVVDSRPDVPVFVASQAVMNAIVGFDIHRGCLALGAPRPEAVANGPLDRWLDRSTPSDAMVVVMEGINNHDNVGGIFRNAAAFGAAACLLDAATADPLYRKALRVSMGSALRVPFTRATRASWAEALRRAGFGIVALTPRPSAVPLPEVEVPSGRVALVVGAEGPGLADETLSLADVRVRIPIDPSVDSLNVAMAAGVALYELRRGRRGLRDPAPHRG